MVTSLSLLCLEVYYRYLLIDRPLQTKPAPDKEKAK
jgi:hypothetical protein